MVRGVSAETPHDRGDRLALSAQQLEVDRTCRQAGEVRVGKHVETEHVRRDVPVTREEATVGNRGTARDRSAGNARPPVHLRLV
jgi:uncharacterized protein (TIGR02271 family)